MSTAKHFADRIKIGRALSVSPIALGVVTNPSLIPAAFDAGINFFFCTADMHWPQYENVRRGLEQLFARGRNVRRQVVVGVVSYVTQAPFCHAPFREVIASIKGLEHIDLSIIGGAYGADFISRLTQYNLHRREEGEVPVVKAIGATFHDRDAAALAVSHRMLDLAFVRYSPLHPGAEEDVFPHIAGSPVPIYVFNAMRGLVSPERWRKLRLPSTNWRPDPVDYYRFALTPPSVAGLLVALKSESQILDLQGALKRPRLTSAESAYLRGLAEDAIE